METLLNLIVGIGLSAACGFRVFVPLLGMSIASMSGYLSLSHGFEWIGSWPALIAFSTATILEIGTYYIPWIDNIMDALMTPIAVIAGTLATASMISDIPPFFKWSIAVMAGGGVASIIQGGTVALRAASSGTTGGFTNFLVSTAEIIGSIFVTILAIVLPLLCLAVVGWICYKMIKKIVTLPLIIKKRTANKSVQ